MQFNRRQMIGTAVASLVMPSAWPDSRQSAWGSKVDRVFRSKWDERRQGALTVGVVEKGNLTWTGNYGFSDPANGIRASDSTVYPIASVTKVVTGLMLLQLVDRNVVHLTDPVVMLVPEIAHVPNPYPWAPPITLIQLATMTWGIGGGKAFVPDTTQEWDKQLISVLPHREYVYEPGTRRQYSNLAYAVLGLALSRASKRKYTEYIDQEILKPLHMTDTSFALTESQSPRAVFPRAGVDQHRTWENSYVLPAAGLFTTVIDLAKLMAFQLGFGGFNVLSKDALDSSYRLAVPSDSDLQYGDGVGYAVVRNADGHLVAVGHGGRTDGHLASYEFDRSSGSGLILLTTDERTDYYPLVRKTMSELNPRSAGGSGLPPLESH